MPSPASSPASIRPKTPGGSVIRFPQQVGFRKRRRIVIAVSAAIVLCLVAVAGSRIWPFAEKSVLQNLQEASDSAVSIRGFHRTYFPFPGCVLDGVTFKHGPANRTFITIERLTVRGSYSGILSRHIPVITAEGAQVFIPAFGSGETFHSTPSKIVVEELVANGTTIEFASREPGKRPLRFDLHEGRLRDVRWNSPFGYRLRFHNPEPPGEIAVSGNFGQWNTDRPGLTPMSGEYTFDKADLGVYRGIAGTLASRGKFNGVLQHIDISGDTDIPDFEVTSGGHKIRLVTKFSAYVDATRGDTFLKRVDAHLGRTSIIVEGSIAGSRSRKGKVALLNLISRQGRIEDLLGLFVKERRSPMSGAVAFNTKAEIPAGSEPFLKKVKLQARFGIDEGSFSKAETQGNVNHLSAGASGENKEVPETVLTDLKGQVLLESGTANFSDISFRIPGAHARMHGTYNVLNERVDLHGRMRVDSQISQTTTGVKALLLKMMDPFFKHKKKGEVVPVHITGTYDHPNFGLDLAPGTKGQQK